MGLGIGIGWFLCCLVIGSIGSSRKIGFAGSFFLSLLLSPIIGLIITLFSKSNEDIEREEKTMNIQKEQLKEMKEMKKTSVVDELEKLSNLRDKGVLNEDEFNEQKSKIIKGGSIEDKTQNKEIIEASVNKISLSINDYKSKLSNKVRECVLHNDNNTLRYILKNTTMYIKDYEDDKLPFYIVLELDRRKVKLTEKELDFLSLE